MANLYLYLDRRTPRKDGSGSLKVAITHKRQTVYHPLETYIKPEEWDADHQQVVDRPDKKFLNVLLKKRMAEMTLAFQRILLRDDADTFTAKDILVMIVRGTDTVDKPEDMDFVLPIYNEYMTLCAKSSTEAIYRTSLNNIIEYAKDIDSLRFKDMNAAWLRKYQRWLLDTRGMSVNGANVYLRNLRTVFNYARKNDLTQARYPFRDIDMSTTLPEKYVVPFEKFVEWVAAPTDRGRTFYRDLFMLSFYLCGMRPVDLLNVKKSQIQDGRLVYYPEKLNGRTKLSIKIEPEAQAIIDRYAGQEYMLNVMETREDYKTFMQHWNKALKAIGEDRYHEKPCKNGKVYKYVTHIGIIPQIKVYHARIWWSSYAYNELDASIDVISQALGHKNGLRVTNLYVKRSNTKVDELNRRMIDWLNQAVADFHKK